MKQSFIKKALTFALTCVLVLGTISGSAFAKTRDFYDSSTNKIYTPTAMSTDDFNKFIDLVMDHGDKIVYEFNGKYYNYSAILSDYLKNKHTGLSVMNAFNASLNNTANLKQGFDPSAYTGNDDSSDFSVISID